MSLIGRACLNMQIKALMAKERMKEFFRSQEGVANVVATIILLLIVIVLIAAFWNTLKGFVQKLLDKLQPPDISME